MTSDTALFMGEWITLGVLLASETLLGFHIWILDLLALLDTFVPVYWFKASTANKQLAHWKAAFVGDADAQLAADGVRLCFSRALQRQGYVLSCRAPGQCLCTISLCLIVTRNHYFCYRQWQFGNACALVAVIKRWHYPALWGGSCLPSLEYEVVKAVIQESNWAFNVNPALFCTYWSMC